ncbi:GyrI-like domain-containing protein [uncultured Spirosoma sp.]|uniref:GyrI-like domain-containing protein n=1 Tax=uncultured Spirosoma sp. TaxID=278208 RepID=UPI002583E00A|nr:GyrI-like domain-containing protein [uncultured Spirosoma sp.]
MVPTLRMSGERKLVGQRLTMSFNDYKVGQLWQRFMPRRSELRRTSDELISMAVYSSTYFAAFSPSNQFEKWAAVEVANFDTIPTGMESFTLNDGLYAVFDYKGLSTDNAIFQYILGEWLPNSAYTLDNRPHFEILRSRYRNNRPDSEEEIWIPVNVRA